MDPKTNRNPPEEVKRILREEVGFGCPVPDCKEPFLTWHHFDPPWSEQNHHDPEGMIALCLKHHAMADRGVFSKSQLKSFKTSPHFIEEIRAKFEWAKPKQLIRLGGFYMGGKHVIMEPAVNVIVERNFIRLRENPSGLLELSFVLRDKNLNRIAIMENNVFVTNPDHLFDLQVDAGATSIKIRQQKRKILLDLKSSRKSPEEFRKLLEDDWERSHKTLKNRAGEETETVFRDYLMGPLIPIQQEETNPLSLWHDKSSGQIFRSRDHLISFVYDWTMEYCVDEEGLIPILDFRNMLTYIFGRKMEIRNGVEVGQNRSMKFGAHFSEDSPHPNEESGDARLRKPFQFPSSDAL
jgi:hypothetical protein